MTGNYRTACPTCGGRGTTSGPLGLIRVTCGECGGEGYIEPANVVHAPFVTRHDLQPDVVLRAAIGQLDEAIVIGYDKAGNEYFASSVSGGDRAMWHLARAQHRLMLIVDEGQDE